MPLAEFQLIEGRVPVEKARDICEKSLDIVHSEFKIPDPEDREVRISSGNTNKLGIEYTTGEEYEKGVDFHPDTTAINIAGKQIQQICENRVDKVKTEIRAWGDTTFILREVNDSIPTPPFSQEEIRRIGSYIQAPRIKLFISPNHYREVIGPSSPELSSVSQSETELFNKVTSEISRQFSEILGIPTESFSSDVIVPLDADADVSVEFDCQTQPNQQIPEELRKYLAGIVEKIINEDSLTKNGEGEIWIRQNQPDETVFE